MSDEDDDTILEFDGAVVTQAPAPFGEDEAAEDLGADDLDLGDEPPVEPVVAADSARVQQLESAVKQLAGQQQARDQQRLRRKVTAATGGAGAVGFVPIALQLMGILHVTGEVASTVAAVAAAAGALLAGYVTPERPAPLSPTELLH
jgi:hypothetical protein